MILFMIKILTLCIMIITTTMRVNEDNEDWPLNLLSCSAWRGDRTAFVVRIEIVPCVSCPRGLHD